MSKTIDKRVVEMQFDNQQFERGVQTSLKSLDNLNKQLNDLDGARGLEKLGKAADSIDLGSASKEVDNMTGSFSKLEQVGIGALRALGGEITKFGLDIADKVLAPLKSVMSAFTELSTIPLTTVNDGMTKFAQKTGSVGTLISQGYDMDLVTEQLEKLNFFTDETSYNFTDMVNEIGKFTAAGQELDDSVEAMMGIANWAALSGQNATKASQAMYQLSQAMGKGALKLDDYKSIQNANMDTQEFRKNAIEAAKAVGTITEAANGMYTVLKTGKTFTFQEMFTSEALTKGAWLSSDVMMKTFKKYSAAVDQIYEKVNSGVYETASEAIEAMGGSLDEFGLKAFKAAQEARSWTDVVDSLKDAASTSWMNIFESIFGNYEEAKDLFTDMANNFYDVLVTPIQDIGDIFKTWKDLGGRDVWWESFWVAFENIGKLLDPIKDAFHEIFGEFDPEAMGEKLYKLTLRFRDWAQQIGWTEETAESLKSVFKGLFSILKTSLNGIKTLWKVAQPLIDLAGKAVSVILRLGGALGETVSGLFNFQHGGEGLLSITERIEAVILGIGEPLKTFKDNLSAIFDAHWLGKDNGIFNTFNTLHEILKSIVALVIDTVSAITGIDLSEFEGNVVGAMDHIRDSIRLTFYNIGEFLHGKFGQIGDAISKVFTSGKNFFTDREFRNKMLSAGQDLINGLIEGMRQAVLNIPNTIKSIVNTIIDTFKNLFGIHSPSVVMAAIGKLLIEGLALGIKSSISDYIKPAIHSVVDTIVTFFQTPDLVGRMKEIGSNIMAGISAGIQNGKNVIFPKIAEIVRAIVDKFKELLGIKSPSKVMEEEVGKQIPAGVGVGLQNGMELLNVLATLLFGGFVEKLKKLLAPIGPLLKEVFAALGNVFSGIVNSISGIGKGLAAAGKSLQEYFGKMNIDAEFLIKELRKIIALVAVFWVIKKMIDIFESITTVASKFAGAFESVGKGLGSVAKSFADLNKTIKRDIKMRLIKDLVKDLALTLLMITASIYIMGKLKPEVLIEGAKRVAIIAAVLGGIVVSIMLIASLTRFGISALANMQNLAASFIAVGASIFLVAMAVVKLSKIDTTGLAQAQTTLIGIAAFFTIYSIVVMIASQVLGGEAVDNIWQVLLGAAGAVWILASAICKLAKVPEDQMLAAMSVIAVLEIIAMGFATLMMSVGKLGKGQTAMKLTGLAAAILAIGICVNLLVTAMRHVAILSENTGAFIAALGTIIAIIAMLALVMAAASKMNRAWKSLLSLAALFAAMGLVIKVVGEMNSTDIGKGCGALLGLSFLIVALSVVTALINKHFGSDQVADVAKTLIGAAAAIGILGLVVKMLTDIPLPQLAKATAAVMALGVVMALLVGIAGWSNGQAGTLSSSTSGSWKKKSFSSSSQKSNGAGIKQLIGIAISIGILAYTVAKLADIPFGGLIKATATVTALSVIVGLFMVVMSQISQNEKVKTSTIIALGVSIALITGALVVLAQFGDEIPAMLAGAFGIALIIAALGFAMRQIANIGDSKNSRKNMKSMVTIIVSLTLIAAMLFILGLNSDKIDWAVLAAFGGSLAAIMLSIGFALKCAKDASPKDAGALLLATLALIPVAAALVAIGYFVKGEDWPSIAVGGLAMAGVVAVLALILSKAGELKIGSAATLLVASLALVPVGIALSLVARQDWGSILAAMGAVSLTIFAVAVTLRVIAEMDIKKALIGILGLAAVAAGIYFASLALSNLAQYDWGAILASMVSIVGVLAVATLCTIALGGLAESGTALLGLIVFAGMAASLLLVGMSLSMVAQYDWNNIFNAMIAMVAVIGVATLAVAALGALAYAGGVSIIGVAVLAGIAVSLLIFAAALEVAAIACQTFLTAISEFFVPERAQEIIGFFETLGEGIPVAAEKISTGIQTAILVFQAAAPLITESMKLLINAIADGLVEMAKVIGDRGVDVVNAIADMIDKIKQTVEQRFGINSPSTYFIAIGGYLMAGLAEGIKKFIGKPVDAVKSMATTLISKVKGVFGIHSPSLVFKVIGGLLVSGLGAGILDNLGSCFSAGESMGEATEDGFMSGAAGFLNGDIAKQLGSQLGIDLGDNFKLGDLKNLDLSNLDLSKFNFEGIDSLDITNFLNQLKDAGVEVDGIDETLENIQNKDNTIEFKAELDTTSIEQETKKVMDGTYGNGVERWKKMYEEYLKAYNGDVAKALDAVSQIQNEVNKKLGSSVTHNAEEMAKKLGVSAEELKKAQAATTTAKEPRDFKKDPYTAKPETAADKAKAQKAADEQMKNNMPYENYMAIKEGQITKEKEKQTAEAYKQLEANTHITTLSEKQTAEAKLKANQELANNTTLTDAKKKQLEAENQTYQAVISRYEQEQKMRDEINKNTEAQKKQTEAVNETKKAAEETAKASAGIKYGSDEYYQMTAKSGATINTQAAKATPAKVETAPVKAETKVEVEPKLEVTKVDASEVKAKVIEEVEKQTKDVQPKVEITPKVNTTEAERNMENFKRKTDDLAKSVPKSFEGISTEIQKFMTNISNSIKSKGPEFESTVRSTFVNAVSKASAAINSNDVINKFTNAGVQAANGLVKGLRSKISEVEKAGKALGDAAAKSTKTALKEKSPSRIMAEIGAYAGQGQVNGMLSTISDIYNAGSQMAEAAIDGVGENIDALSKAMNSDIDYSPTIIPVVDTSKVQGSISSINNAIGQDRVQDITSNVEMKRTYTDMQLESMQSQMTNLQSVINDLSSAILSQPTPEVNANVVLQGDADGVFKLVRNSNAQYTKMHGKSAFA